MGLRGSWPWSRVFLSPQSLASQEYARQRVASESPRTTCQGRGLEFSGPIATGPGRVGTSHLAERRWQPKRFKSPQQTSALRPDNHTRLTLTTYVSAFVRAREVANAQCWRVSNGSGKSRVARASGPDQLQSARARARATVHSSGHVPCDYSVPGYLGSRPRREAARYS